LGSKLQQAQRFHGDTSGEVPLKSGELHYVSIPGSLIEERAGQRTFVGGSQGISIPIGTIGGRGIRYRFARMKGHVVQAPAVATVIDEGTIVVTNQRVVFEGLRQTRECLFAKLAGTTALNAATYLDMAVRARPASTGPAKPLAAAPPHKPCGDYYLTLKDPMLRRPPEFAVRLRDS
jgi:hypothetical protein